MTVEYLLDALRGGPVLYVWLFSLLGVAIEGVVVGWIFISLLAARRKREGRK